MKQLIIIATLLLAASLPCLAQDKESLEEPKKILADYVDQQAKLLNALKATKTESDLEELDLAVKDASERMNALAKDLGSHGPFSDQVSRTLWSLRATREYELLGAATMAAAMQDAPEDLRPKIMQVFQGSMQDLQAADEQLNKSLKKKNPGPGRGQAWLPLDREFVASVSTAHKEDPFTDPAIAMMFSIDANQKDGSSIVLYDQVIPWEGAIPTKDELMSWITYSRETGVVTFTHPSGKFTHQLPKER